MNPIRIAVVGLGKIARDQHLPSIRASNEFELVAVASPHSRLDSFPSYDSLESLLQAHHDVQAVALCMPPQARAAIARVALRRGCHVLLEKPPGTSIAEVEELSRLADERRLTLFASWHSRHGCAVEPARTWLERKRILRVSITWKEDVRVWHPGQDWIWTAEGFGAFDPGINALSILTRIAPGALVLKRPSFSFRQTALRRARPDSPWRWMARRSKWTSTSFTQALQPGKSTLQRMRDACRLVRAEPFCTSMAARWPSRLCRNTRPCMLILRR